MGEDYMAKLLAEEETNANLKSIQERAEELTNSYRDLKFAINEVADAATSDKLTDDQRERAAINAVSSLALGSELQKQAALAAQGPEGAAAVEAVIASFREKIEKSNLREVNQELFDAVMEGDTDTVLRLERFSRTYQGVITELRDKISQIPQALSQGDTFALTQLLEEVQRARDVADESAAGLGRRSESADIIGNTLSGFGGIDAAAQVFEATRKRSVELSNEALAIERERVKLANVPSMTRSYLEREINLKREKNKLSVLENQLQDINNKLRDNPGDTRILEAQKAEIEQRILNQTAQVKNAEVLFDDLGNAGVQVAQTIESSMATAFQGIIEGTMSAKEAFASMAKSVLSMIARIVTELIVARIIASALGGAFGGINASTGMTDYNPGFDSANLVRYGGIQKGPMGYRNGGIAKNYSMGGVAAGRDGGYPAILHGTEAVVPLPNNRSIPVDLQGNAGQQNNVTVNVSIDRDGQASQDTQADSNEGANMGKLLAMAVQEELLNQKRQGGILNPFGVS
jgi:lambda family phage tail tape measure protein